MYSGVISWFFRSLLGIFPLENAPAFEKIELKPVFIESLEYAKGSMETARGRIEAEWVFRDGKYIYSVNIPKGISAIFRGKALTVGQNVFFIENLKS
jgi:alpha-L-rhamnosidase